MTATHVRMVEPVKTRSMVIHVPVLLGTLGHTVKQVSSLPGCTGVHSDMGQNLNHDTPEWLAA